MAEEKYISKVRIGNENFTIRDKDSYKLAQEAKTAINTMASLTPEKLSEITNNINLIKQELAGTPANEWTTLVDKLAGIDNTVIAYVDTAVAGAKAYADNQDIEVKNSLRGLNGDLWPTQQTIYGVAKYAETLSYSSYAAVEALEGRLIGNTADTTINTHWGVKNSLIGTASDNKDSNTIKGAKKYADNVKTQLIGNTADTTINTHYGLKNTLIGKHTDATTADTIWGAKNYAVKTLRGSTGDTATYETIYGVRKYTDEKIKTLSNTAFKVRRIEYGGEGILEFSTVSSYAG